MGIRKKDKRRLLVNRHHVFVRTSLRLLTHKKRDRKKSIHWWNPK